MSEPRYEHDCEKCAHLGPFGKFDVYFCWQGGDMPTTVMRFGNEPEEYQSGIHLFDRLPSDLQDATRAEFAKDPGVQRMLRLLNDNGPMHYEHLEHAWTEGEPTP